MVSFEEDIVIVKGFYALVCLYGKGIVKGLGIGVTEEGVDGGRKDEHKDEEEKMNYTCCLQRGCPSPPLIYAGEQCRVFGT